MNKDGTGECWVEECNMRSDCKPYTCTRWEYVASENFWTAEDCDDHVDDKDGDCDLDFIVYVFGHAGKVLSHYDDTLALVADHYVDNLVEDFDAEPIDDFLANDDAVHFTSTFLQDTDDMLDAFGVDADLDWAHEALTAENSDELWDMFDHVFDDFWGSDEDGSYDDKSEGDHHHSEGDREEWSGHDEEWDKTDHDDDECIRHEKSDCKEMIENHVDGLEYCFFEEIVDVCNKEVVSCHVSVTIHGQDVEGECTQMLGILDIDPEDL